MLDFQFVAYMGMAGGLSSIGPYTSLLTGGLYQPLESDGTLDRDHLHVLGVGFWLLIQ